MQRFPFVLLGAAASGAFVLACGGIDPNDYGAQPAPASHAGQAGYSYDAGVSAAGGSSRAGAGGTPGSTQPKGPRAGGAAGQEGEAGADSTADAGEGGLQGAGGASDGGTGGTGGGGEAGSGAAQTGGVAGQAGWSWGGRAGAPTAGRGGAGGQAGRGGRAGAGAGGAAGRGDAGVGGTGDPKPSPVHDFVFSEYVEGSGRRKALEIRAGRASSLTGCQIATYSNGDETGRRLALTVGGDVASGDVYVLCSLDLEGEIGAACDRATSLGFNGNDAIALECGGLVLDVIGRIGEDPGTAWEANGAATADRTLRRLCSTPTGDPEGTDAFDPSAQWLALPADSVDGLGDPACAETPTN